MRSAARSCDRPPHYIGSCGRCLPLPRHSGQSFVLARFRPPSVVIRARRVSQPQLGQDEGSVGWSMCTRTVSPVLAVISDLPSLVGTFGRVYPGIAGSKPGASAPGPPGRCDGVAKPARLAGEVRGDTARPEQRGTPRISIALQATARSRCAPARCDPARWWRCRCVADTATARRGLVVSPMAPPGRGRARANSGASVIRWRARTVEASLSASPHRQVAH